MSHVVSALDLPSSYKDSQSEVNTDYHVILTFTA